MLQDIGALMESGYQLHMSTYKECGSFLSFLIARGYFQQGEQNKTK